MVLAGWVVVCVVPSPRELSITVVRLSLPVPHRGGRTRHGDGRMAVVCVSVGWWVVTVGWIVAGIGGMEVVCVSMEVVCGVVDEWGAVVGTWSVVCIWMREAAMGWRSDCWRKECSTASASFRSFCR